MLPLVDFCGTKVSMFTPSRRRRPLVHKVHTAGVAVQGSRAFACSPNLVGGGRYLYCGPTHSAPVLQSSIMRRVGGANENGICLSCCHGVGTLTNSKQLVHNETIWPELWPVNKKSEYRDTP